MLYQHGSDMTSTWTRRGILHSHWPNYFCLTRPIISFISIQTMIFIQPAATQPITLFERVFTTQLISTEHDHNLTHFINFHSIISPSKGHLHPTSVHMPLLQITRHYIRNIQHCADPLNHQLHLCYSNFLCSPDQGNLYNKLGFCYTIAS